MLRRVEKLVSPMRWNADFLESGFAWVKGPEVFPGLFNSGCHLHILGNDSSVRKQNFEEPNPRGLIHDSPMSKAREARRVLAANVAGLMKLRDWKQADLGKKAGVDQKSISNIVNAKCSAQLDVIEQIARAFDLEAHQLISPNLFPPGFWPDKAA